MSLPKMVEIRQRIPTAHIGDVTSAVKKELERIGLPGKVGRNMRVAITAGSRGIACYPEILAAVVKEVKSAGGNPVIVPAMGSHGGSTSKGQLDILGGLGITPDAVNAPIHSSMEVKELGRLDDNTPVYIDKFALNSDGIIVVNRVKPHTDFKDRIESGLMKMMTIGLGKQKGAEMIHRHQSKGYHKKMPEAARLIIKEAPILLGLAVVENASHEISIVKALTPEEFEHEESKLLERAKTLIARIPFKDIDVLIIDEMGKNISGMGMDTNVIGRFWVSGEKPSATPDIRRIVVLDLSDESHGNATGIGLADITTKRLVDKIDFHATATNCLTACWPEVGKIPISLPNDREAILAALHACGQIDSKRAKMVRIKNTLELNRMRISESLYESARVNSDLSEEIEVLGEPKEWQFDALGSLQDD